MNKVIINYKELLINSYLKLVYAIFYQIFIFSPNDITSKIMKNVFYFIKKALFVLEILKFLYFFPSFPQFSDSKGQMEVE